MANDELGPSATRLIEVVQQLSLARELGQVMDVVRRAARELTGADGATFVLRDDDLCFYAEEDAIEPLWKGRRFPLNTCISGWAMIHREAVVIENIYEDPRIPHDAYRPTFVKSLAMVPIRTAAPVGAIGNYWARHHTATPSELRLLQALANSTAIAIENVRLYADLERRVRERTAELQFVNAELEAFAARVSHDLRAPLRSIHGFANALVEDFGATAAPSAAHYLDRIRNSADRMSQLIDNLLQLARVGRGKVRRERVDVTKLAHEIAAEMHEREPARAIAIEVAPELEANADPGLLRIVFENLLGNAWKFTQRVPAARVDVRGVEVEGGTRALCVGDNGAGFDPARSSKLFEPFNRLHSEREFAGTGIGLATVHRIVELHGGRIWADASVGGGARFYFTLE